MIWFRGANIFPSAVEAAVRRIAELTPEYQIEISGESALPKMLVRAEALRPDLRAEEIASLRTRLGEALKDSIRVTAAVEILAPGTLPRPDGRKKIQRVVDKRVR
jgi:phenylacetate-CoA ligase